MGICPGMGIRVGIEEEVLFLAPHVQHTVLERSYDPALCDPAFEKQQVKKGDHAQQKRGDDKGNIGARDLSAKTVQIHGEGHNKVQWCVTICNKSTSFSIQPV